MISIRPEEPRDIPAVRRVNERAFAQPEEADIVDRIRSSCPEALSLVACLDEAVIGHILFSPAIIEWEGGTLGGMGLAPMAVLPGRQRQ